MTEIYNLKSKTKLRRKLRHSQTASEIKLWRYLRNKQINNLRFRRQYGIGKYVVDFYCPELKLVIEVDGANHFFDDVSTKYDTDRQKYIESLGIKVLRVTTTDVFDNIDGVLQFIYENLPPPSLPLRKVEEKIQ